MVDVSKLRAGDLVICKSAGYNSIIEYIDPNRQLLKFANIEKLSNIKSCFCPGCYAEHGYTNKQKAFKLLGLKWKILLTN